MPGIEIAIVVRGIALFLLVVACEDALDDFQRKLHTFEMERRLLAIKVDVTELYAIGELLPEEALDAVDVEDLDGVTVHVLVVVDGDLDMAGG